MAYTTINKSSLHFNTVQWTGNASTNAITGVGFRPDWIWGKSHTSGYSHQLYDVVRGATYSLKTNGYTAQETLSTGLTSFDSDGFTLGSNTNINASGHTVTGWNWKAGNSQGSSNTDGSINTTYTSVNTTAGFSISTYTGTGSNATIGHGLGAVPSVVIVKRYATQGDWIGYFKALGNTKNARFNTTDAADTNSTVWNSTTPTSSVFSVGTFGETNSSGGTFVAYCFAEKTGFSKFGSYTGNGNADGAFIYTGFKPAWIMQKRTDSANNWNIYDVKRNTFNIVDKYLYADDTSAEITTSALDITSNGFKCRNASTFLNASGGTYIFMAFAEAPLVGSNNVPCTAR
jgi:hypothetical protein